MNIVNNFLRDVAGQTMIDLAHANDRIIAVSADVFGSCRMNEFIDKFPERAFNVGIAEQEMVSFAAGLAREGFKPFCFTFGPFMSMRACEQIRDDIAYNGLGVCLISTYSGVSGGISGATHWAVEDCSIIRGIPQMTILEPCDCQQLRMLMREIVDYDRPTYIRLTIEPVSEIYDNTDSFQIGKGKCIADGDDGSFICSGITVKYALEASKYIWNKWGKSIKVIDMYSIKPIDEKIIVDAASTGNIIVAQDHNIYGGLGDAVSSVLTKNGIGVKYRVLGMRDEFVPSAHVPYLYHSFDIDTIGLIKEMEKMLNLLHGMEDIV